MLIEVKKIAPPKAVLKRYWRYLRSQWRLLFVVLAAALILQAAELGGPLFMRIFFNTLASGVPSPATAHTLLTTLGLVAMMWLISWASRRGQDLANTHLTARIMAHLYSDSFDYLLRHSYNFFISNFAGTLTTRVSRYSRSFESIFDTILLNFLPAVLYVLGAATLLYTRNHTLGLVLFSWAVVFVWFQFYIAKWRQPSRNARAEAESRVTGSLADAIGNQATITQFAGVAHERGIFAEVVGRWREATLRSWTIDGWTWGFISLFVIALQGGILWVAIIFWQRGMLTVGDFVLIQSYLLGTLGQLTGIGYQLRRFYDSFADAGEMVAILDSTHEIVDRPGAQKLIVTKRDVAFDDVTFHYGGESVLENFSVHIPGAQKVALVGPSGAGKSTVTKLLLRLYDVPEGQILIDGQNIAAVTQDSLREAIAFVPQEPILFHRTLMENIRYGRRDATDEEVLKAARQAHCHEFIDRLPLKYDTYVGERGIKLSGGERQRVAIARAILKNAPILVLDEATSSLDSESEALIQDALATLMQDKTVLVIAHRLSTIMKMDRILVLEAGQVVADGTHHELLAQGGLYHKLWSIQAGGFLKDDGSDPQIEAPEPAEPDIDELAGEDEEK